MSNRGISHIYHSIPKMGGKKPDISTPSDRIKQARKSSIIEPACTIYTRNGMLNARNVRNGDYGPYVSINGHEIKVQQIGYHHWMERGMDRDAIKFHLHPAELADMGLTDKAVKIHNDYTPSISTRKQGKQHLTGQVSNLTPAQFLDHGHVVSIRSANISMKQIKQMRKNRIISKDEARELVESRKYSEIG